MCLFSFGVISLFLLLCLAAHDLTAYDCCDAQESSLYQCILMNSFRLSSSPNIGLVTYGSSNIASYSKYTFGVNNNYAQYHGYSFAIYEESFVMGHSDPRWNKIWILLHALKSDFNATEFGVDISFNFSELYSAGWASSFDYIVWIDADLAIVDLDFSIEKLGDIHLGADLLMAKDLPKAPFISNSGFIFVRNTPFVIDILQRWWWTYDKRRCCDQNAFTWLYDSLDNHSRSKIAIVAIDAVNTYFPCWRHHQDHNPVLHLAGVTSLYRIQVFSLLWHRSCRILVSQTNIKYNRSSSPVVRMISRSELYALVVDLNNWRRLRLQEIRSELMSFSSLMTSKLPLLSREIDDILKFDDEEPHQIEDILDIAIQVKYLLWQRQIEALHLTVESNTSMQQLYDDNIVSIVVTGMDVAVLQLKPPQEFGQYLPSRFFVLHQLSCLLVNHSWGLVFANDERNSHSLCNMQLDILQSQRYLKENPQVDYFRFKLCTLIASWYHTVLTANQSVESLFASMINSASFDDMVLLATFRQNKDFSLHLEYPRRGMIVWLHQAVYYWKIMASRNYFGSYYLQADPYKEIAETLHELGVLQCLDGDKQAGQTALWEALHWQYLTLHGYQDIRIVSTDIEKLAWIAAANMWTNLGVCMIDMDHIQGKDQLFSRETFSTDVILYQQVAKCHLMSQCIFLGKVENVDVSVKYLPCSDMFSSENREIDPYSLWKSLFPSPFCSYYSPVLKILEMSMALGQYKAMELNRKQLTKISKFLCSFEKKKKSVFLKKKQIS